MIRPCLLWTSIAFLHLISYGAANFCQQWRQCERTARNHYNACLGGLAAGALVEKHASDIVQHLMSRHELRRQCEKRLEDNIIEYHKRRQAVEQNYQVCLDTESAQHDLLGSVEKSACSSIKTYGAQSYDLTWTINQCRHLYLALKNRCQQRQTCCPAQVKCYPEIIDSDVFREERKLRSQLADAMLRCLMNDDEKADQFLGQNATAVVGAPPRSTEPTAIKPQAQINLEETALASAISIYDMVSGALLKMASEEKTTVAASTTAATTTSQQNHIDNEPARQETTTGTPVTTTTRKEPETTRAPVHKETPFQSSPTKPATTVPPFREPTSTTTTPPPPPNFEFIDEPTSSNMNAKGIISRDAMVMLCNTFVDCHSMVMDEQRTCDQNLATEAETFGLRDPFVREQFISASRGLHVPDDITDVCLRATIDSETQNHLETWYNVTQQDLHHCIRTSLFTDVRVTDDRKHKCLETSVLSAVSEIFRALNRMRKDSIHDDREKCMARIAMLDEKCTQLRQCCSVYERCEKRSQSQAGARHLAALGGSVQQRANECSQRFLLKLRDAARILSQEQL